MQAVISGRPPVRLALAFEAAFAYALLPEAAILSEILIVVALVLANGFFSGSEIALVTLRRSRLQELYERGSRSAGAALALREAPEQFLATVQVGITVVGATAAAFGGASIADRLVPLFAALPIVAPYAKELALGSVVALVSYLSIVVGELVPKSIALRSAESYGLLAARPLRALSWVARPLIWLLTKSSNLILKPFGDSTTFTEARFTPEELQQIVEDATKAGTLHPQAGEIASRAFDLPSLTAADVMVPRQDVVMLERDAEVAEVLRVLRESHHTRYPVYVEARENIAGYVTIKDLAAHDSEVRPMRLADVLRPAFYVPSSKAAPDLLREMQRKRVHLAIAVDETGGMDGIVTLEDLVEEVVGEIFSEHAREGSQPAVFEADGGAVVSGTLPIREVNRMLELELPDDGDWTTIAGLCIHLAGRIPVPGDRLEAGDGVVLEIVDASVRRVRSVRVRRPEPGV